LVISLLARSSTGAIRADRHVDEGIHLASTFQLAGFRHVIGTLWEVSDAHCVDIARIVYETIRDNGMTDRRSIKEFIAVRALRDGQIKMISARDHSSVTETAVEEMGCEARDATLLESSTQKTNLIDLHWIPYVHFGV
jgi:CHAT domain-containing protein